MYSKFYFSFGGETTALWVKDVTNLYHHMRDGLPLEGYSTAGQVRTVNVSKCDFADVEAMNVPAKTVNIILNQRPKKKGDKFCVFGKEGEFEVSHFLTENDVELTYLEQTMTSSSKIKVVGVGEMQLFRLQECHLVIVK